MGGRKFVWPQELQKDKVYCEQSLHYVVISMKVP